MESTPWPVQVVLVIVIAIYAYDRFNSPPTNRACTTAARYHVAAFIYFSLYLLTFHLVVRYPELVGFMGFDVQGPLADLEVSSAVGIALLLTVLLPRAPVLSNVDLQVRKHLQRRAAIPIEATRLSRELCGGELEVPGEERAGLEAELVGSGFDAQHVVYDGAEYTHTVWVKIEYLMWRLQELESNSKFASFMHDRAQEYARLKTQHKSLRTKAKTCFGLHEHLREIEDDEKYLEVLGAYEGGLRDDVEEMFKATCDFVSQAVLSCRLTHGGRWELLGDLGFKRQESNGRPSLGANHVIALASILIPVFLINFIFFAPKRPEVAHGLLIPVMIVTVYCVAVICAALPKDRWSFSTRSDKGFRPWCFFIMAGFAAVLVGFPINLGFKTLIVLTQDADPALGEAFNQAWESLVAFKWPYFFLSFMMAAVTAFHLDNRPSPWLNGISLRALESMSLAGIQAATAYFVFELLSRLAEQGEAVHVPPLERLVIISAVVGAVVGFLVPEWYRRTSRAQEPAEPEATRSPPPGDVGHAAPAAV
jgi:hypothetical protein